ncbi:DUF5959 family protein [Streptomyces sp. NPDC020917]|uniref:DUF5959 family protein n=1 Tax=Streptomyces sp. NPDC020917 TaxID=3365102 RepID=UPI00379CBAEF
MAEEPIDLIRLEGNGSSVVLRITGPAVGEGTAPTGSLAAEYMVDTPFVRGTLTTLLAPGDLREWQECLDALDAGGDIAWCAGQPVPCLYIDRDADGEDRCQVTVKDHSASLTGVTVTVPLADAWFDDAYRRLEQVCDTWPMT